jgi:hypothetical protein
MCVVSGGAPPATCQQRATGSVNIAPLHPEKWLRLFELNEQSCTPAAVVTAWREQMLIFHPDKYKGPTVRGHRIALIVQVGRMALNNHPPCMHGCRR